MDTMNTSQHPCDVAYAAGVLYGTISRQEYRKENMFTAFVEKHYKRRMLSLVEMGVYIRGEGWTDTRLMKWFERGMSGKQPTKTMKYYYDELSKRHSMKTFAQAEEERKLDKRFYTGS